MEVRRWNAFLRLSGESQVNRVEEILTEFKGFAQSLKRVGIESSIILNVEDCARSNASSQEHFHSRVHDSSVKMGGN